MSPRALTDQEKELQRQKLMTKARELVLDFGVKKVSIDDIVKAAGMAKGSFYHHFSGKEELLMQLVWEIYRDFVSQAARIIESGPAGELRHNVGALIRSIIHDRDKVFFFNNHQDLEDLIAAMNRDEMRSFNQLEYEAFSALITSAGLDIQKVKPAVVHNYIHAMYFASSDGCMISEHLEETVDAMLKGLLDYIFGPKM